MQHMKDLQISRCVAYILGFRKRYKENYPTDTQALDPQTHENMLSEEYLRCLITAKMSAENINIWSGGRGGGRGGGGGGGGGADEDGSSCGIVCLLIIIFLFHASTLSLGIFFSCNYYYISLHEGNSRITCICRPCCGGRVFVWFRQSWNG
jgi:hypothetical protein